MRDIPGSPGPEASPRSNPVSVQGLEVGEVATDDDSRSREYKSVHVLSSVLDVHI